VAETIRLAHRALELDPRFGPVAALAGLCHTRNVLWGYSTDPQFERKEAVRLVRLALSIDDSDPETLARAGIISAYMVGDSESEIELVDRAVALNPNSYSAWSCRGYVNRTAGLSEEAVRSFEHAIRVSPVDAQLHLTLGGIGAAFIELGRFDEAIAAGKKALRWRRRVCLRSIPPFPREAFACRSLTRIAPATKPTLFDLNGFQIRNRCLQRDNPRKCVRRLTPPRRASH
jgi:adenylate cyclase